MIRNVNTEWLEKECLFTWDLQLTIAVSEIKMLIWAPNI